MNRAASSLLSWAAIAGVCSALAQPQLQPLWQLSPDVRPYLTTGNQQRGIAYNPVTGHVLVVNRAGGESIHILDGTTGADLGTLPFNAALITGGLLKVNMIGVAQDGAIYVGNLSANAATDNFRLYRWAGETAQPKLVFSGTPAPGRTDGANNALRFGDTLDVRGAGATTQVLLGSRGANFVSVLTTADGETFTANLVQSDVTGTPVGNGPFGLGLAFGDGNTFWGKSSGGTPLRELTFDLASSSAVTIGTTGPPGVSDDIRNLAVYASAAPALLAGINNVDHTVSLFDVSGPTPILLDREAFPVANTNPFGVGAADFGGGKLFALDANNGLVAYDIIPEPRACLLLALGLGTLWSKRRHACHRQVQ